MTRRYHIGIDLGTSNCALAYLDTLEENSTTLCLAIPQLEMPNAVAESTTLPSFLYLTTAPERDANVFTFEERAATEGGKYAIGLAARNQASTTPGRVIQSAKSWLCHPGVDQEEKLLPWGSEDVAVTERLSPVVVSAKLLRSLSEAWDETLGKYHPEYAFAKQDVTVTVPASFDESAQALTLKAAELAGFPSAVRLLEEPQAAFYFWLEKHATAGLKGSALELLPALKQRAQTVLVCDIGGGTTDFSLFEIQPVAPRARVPVIKRIAVSDHILLGGDNIDLALAKRIEHAVKGAEGRLSARQWSYTAFLCRGLKEKILGAAEGAPDETFHVTIPGEGSSLFAKNLSTEIRREELMSLITEGFFPEIGAAERPARATRGLKELGLPFATDTAVTRHLAAFLNGRGIDAVLFNGGTLKPRFLRDRLVGQITTWQNGRAPVSLTNDEMDLAVAHGAAYFGSVLKKAIRIRGGYPHSIFVELYREKPEETPRLLCLLPKGFEAGDKLKLTDLAFQLLIDRPVRFQLYYSNTREGDRAGDIVALDEDAFRPLPPLQTQLTLKEGMELPKRGMLDITLKATVSETGLLQLYCVHGLPSGKSERWQLDFNLRKTTDIAEENASATGPDPGVAPGRLEAAIQRIELFYGKKRLADVKDTPKNLKRELEKILGLGMNDWNIALLRALWPPLAQGTRGRSPAHEMTWLYLAGFLLRPGYGADLDPWRISELWRVFPQGPVFPTHSGTMNQWWLLWRRVSGGLDAVRQTQVMGKILTPIRNRNDVPAEVILLAGSLERASVPTKKELGEILVRQLARKKVATIEQHFWALGRIASRAPVYAGTESILPPHEIAPWVEKLAGVEFKGTPVMNTNLFFSQACRLTGHRNIDVPEELRAMALRKMEALGASGEQLRMVREIVATDEAAQASVFGEALPSGLRLAAA